MIFLRLLFVELIVEFEKERYIQCKYLILIILIFTRGRAIVCE